MDLSLAWIDSLTDLSYLTGSIQNWILLVPVKSDPLFYVRKSLQRAGEESPLSVVPYPGRKSMVREVLSMMGSGKGLGMAMDATPASTFISLMSKLHDCIPVDISIELKSQRAVKSEWEIAQIEKAAQQAELLFHEIAEFLGPGITDIEASASIERRLRMMGHGGTIRVRRTGSDLALILVVSGDAAMYPTSFDGPLGGEGPYPSAAIGSGWKEMKRGETVIVDMVTLYNGYHADHSRTYYLGKEVPDKIKEAHAFCIEVLTLLEKRLRPGEECAKIFCEVQSWVEKHKVPEGFMGYGENRVRFFGHGVGLELDEFPVIADRIDQKLRPGMVLAIEPKAFLKGVGPVGVENTYLVTETGCRSLCEAELDIQAVQC